MIIYNTEQHLGPKAFFLMWLRPLLVSLILFVIAFILAVASDLVVSAAVEFLSVEDPSRPALIANIQALVASGINILFSASLLLLVGSFFVVALIYANYTYTIQEFDLKLKRGVLYKQEVSISYRQMQDINIDRSLIYQILGVSRLLIDSAGHEGHDEPSESEIVLQPMEKETADELRVFLERKIGVQIVRSMAEADKEAVTA